MTGPDHPAGDKPQHDWRTEVDWPHVRRLTRLHCLCWAFGAVQVALYQAGLLTGGFRTLVGVVDYLAWAGLLVLWARIVVRAGRDRGSARMVSPRTFMILVAFMTSLGAWLVLLHLIDLHTILLV